MATRHVTALVCIRCEARFAPEEASLTCPACAEAGILDVEYDLDRVRQEMTAEHLGGRPRNHWRYMELLPVDPDNLPPLDVGGTPVYEVPRLGEVLGIDHLLIKDEGKNPTASFKDRASSVGVARALHEGQTTLSCSSTGNAATSLAGLAASVGLRSVIFVPERAPEPKLTQLAIFGARVLRVLGSYEDCFRLSMEACQTYGWYNRNCAINPYLVEGKKTAGLEIAEEFGRSMPDWVAVSVGDGCTIAGIWKGLQQMHALGFTDRLPRLLGVQAEGACPIAEAFHTGTELRPGGDETLADSIAVGTPRNGQKALRALREAHGAVTTVSDEALLEALQQTASLTGVFVEPAAAATVAGVARAAHEGILDPAETVLCVLTGNGLKDTRSARKAAEAATGGGSILLDVEPSLEAVHAILGETR